MKFSNIVIAICLLAITVTLSSNSSFAQAGPPFSPKKLYRLTTKSLGNAKALDIINDGENINLQLAKTSDYSGQYWKITSLGDGYYRLTNQLQGPEKSLDVVHAGKNDQLQLGSTGNYSGQAWLIKSLGRGYYRLTCEWQGPKKALSALNDGKNNKVHLTKANNQSGQYWKFTEVAAPVSLGPGATSLTLKPGQTMRRGSRITSSNKRYSLKFQTDGNLVFYGPNDSYIWDAETSGKGETCTLQTDGNLVIYDRQKKPVWSSETMGYFDRKFASNEWKPVKLDVSNSGVCALKSVVNKIAWSRGENASSGPMTRLTSGQTMKRGSSIMSLNRRYELRFQADGNMVFYGPNDSYLWDAKTERRGETCVLQADGNLVIYDRAKKPIWSSETMGYFDRKFASKEWKPVKLQISNSGICALISATNKIAWSCGKSPSSNRSTMLETGKTLSRGTGVSSANGKYNLLFQTDGNLVFYGPNESYIWDAKTGGRGASCILQADGNLVIYDRVKKAVWSSKTMAYFDRKFAMTEWKPVKLEISDIGVCALKSEIGNVVWVCGDDGSYGLLKTLASGQSLTRGTAITCSDRSYTLKFLRDGNLAFYGPNGRLLWDAKTTGRGASCLLQADGNLVIYNEARQPVWGSKTNAYFDRKFSQRDWKPVKLEVSNTGICALVSATNRIAWSVGNR